MSVYVRKNEEQIEIKDKKKNMFYKKQKWLLL